VVSGRGPVEPRRLGEISTANPTLTQLGAYSRDWLLPLFAEHLEPVEGSVSAEWFHERVAEALQEAREDKEWQGDRSPSSRCAWWVKQRWLDTEMSDSGARYRLSPYSLRALRFVREIAEGESTVSGARLGSIAYAVRRLADMTSPDRLAQAQRIDEEIAELQRRKQEVLAGRGATATVAQLSEQLREVLAMTRSLPADFRQLRSMVEDRHKVIARDALAETPKADMVESYLHENDLLASTPEGVAYRRFARMLSSSEESATIQRDLDQILVAPFAREHMTPLSDNRWKRCSRRSWAPSWTCSKPTCTGPRPCGASSPGPRTGSTRGCYPCRQWLSKRRQTGWQPTRTVAAASLTQMS
jgi:hypothetical protein